MRSFNRLLQLLLREQAPPMIIERETLWHKLLDSREKTKIIFYSLYDSICWRLSNLPQDQ